MEVLYKSTRGDGSTVTASEAILKGLAPDGGLYVPTQIPPLNLDLGEAVNYDYKQLAYVVLSKFLSDFTEEELRDCIEKAYDSKFEAEEIAPVVKKGDAYFLELYHGPTIAFKDMALSILPHLMLTSARKNDIHDDIVILTATSGDTGKAALAGFANVPGTRIIVFYPEGGVSNIQRLQMITQKGDNTCVIGVKGNFDDCQRNVKIMFNDKELAKELSDNHLRFSSANSINIGRLVPQVVYYVWAYLRVFENGDIKAGEPVNFVVPTGNFGNILAGYYAKLMGLPVNKLICASNINNVLTDFFDTGVYDKNREFILTSSPSMDILVSSNLERLIYMLTGEDEAANCAFMDSLITTGRYEITPEMKAGLDGFAAGYATEEDDQAAIKKYFEENEYIIDTHTGVAAAVYEKYREKTGDKTSAVIVSTASPFKFMRDVLKVISFRDVDRLSDYDLIFQLDELNNYAGVPQAIKDILALPIRHRTTCGADGMEAAVKKFLGI